jgi:hypothetical protein
MEFANAFALDSLIVFALSRKAERAIRRNKSFFIRSSLYYLVWLNDFAQFCGRGDIVKD